MPHPTTRRLGLLVALAVLAATTLSLPAGADTRPGRYIVSTRSAVDTDRTLRRTGVPVRHRYTRVLNGFAASLTPAQVAALRRDPRVTSVRPDQVLHASDLQTDPPPGLDRIDQHGSELSGSYGYQTTGAGVTAFVIDTGIRLTHHEFGGRAVSGYDWVDGDTDASDCDGHGTHVAGTLGGSTYGVAKQVELVSLRVLDCQGQGLESDFIAALQYVVDHKPAGGAVVNISADGGPSVDLDQAVAAVVADGVPVVVAAGNEDTSACSESPARAATAITVAAAGTDDARASFSDYGSCVDIFAPGVGVKSAYDGSDTDTRLLSGTSMATPHVAGAIARYLQAYPKASPATAAAAMVAESTKDALDDVQGAPDALLYARRSTTYSPRSPGVTTSDAAATSTLTWKPPYGFGSPAVTGYLLSRDGTDAAGHRFPATTVSAATRSYTFTGLRHGSTYALSIKAVNSAGASVAATRSVTLIALPGTARVATPSSGSTSDSTVSITAKWKPPTTGGPVGGYRVAVRRTGSTTTTTPTAAASATNLKVSGLTRNATYAVSVQAVNAAGAGPASTYSKTATAR